MPIYEYRCSKCHNEFELLIRGTEKAKCPDCGSGRLQRQMSVPAASHSSGSECPAASDACQHQHMHCAGSKGCCMS